MSASSLVHALPADGTPVSATPGGHVPVTDVLAPDSTAAVPVVYLSPQDSLTGRLYNEVQMHGHTGTPRPYHLQADDGVTAVVLGCFFLLAYVLAGGKRYLLQQVKDFFYLRERSNLFAEETNVDINYRLLLIVNTCLTGGLLALEHTTEAHADTPLARPLYTLGLYVGGLLVYYLLKSLLYTFVNWVFFDKVRTRIWYDSFFLLFASLGLLFYPLALLAIYFDLSDRYLLLAVVFCLLGEKMLLLHKCTNIFFSHLYGVCHLIVYFCSLEIIPAVLLWQALSRIDSL